MRASANGNAATAWRGKPRIFKHSHFQEGEIFRMTDLQEDKKFVSAMVKHAEALQSQADQMMSKVDARALTLQKTVAQLLV